MKDYINEIKNICEKEHRNNTLIIGGTGSGKTTLIKSLIEEDLKNGDSGITVIDPNGDLSKRVIELSKKYNREVIYFNPIEKNCPSINILDLGIMKLPYILSKICGVYKYEDKQYRLLQNMFMAVHKIYGKDLNLNYINKLINNIDGEAIKIAKKLIVTGEDIYEDIGVWILRDFLGSDNGFYKELKEGLSALLSNEKLNKILNPTDNYSNVINLKEAIEEGKIVIFTTNYPELRSSAIYLNKLIIALYHRVNYDIEPSDSVKPNNLYIEELQRYDYSYTYDILRYSRLKNIQVNMSLQSVSLLNDKRLLEDNIKNKIVLSGLSETENNYHKEKSK